MPRLEIRPSPAGELAWRPAWAWSSTPVVGALVFAFLASLGPIRSVDFFWHLAAGRWMLAHHALPGIDPFRFTSTEPWVDHEWAFQLVLAIAERLGGLGAIVALRALLLTAVAALLLTAWRRRGVPVALAGGLALIALTGLRARLLDRPELASLVAMAALLVLLPRYRERPGPRTALPVLLLVVLWANFHPGALAAPPVTALYLAGAWWSERRGGTAAQPLQALAAALLPIGAALAILVNPWGADLYRVPGRIAAALAGLPASNPDWAPFWVHPQPYLAAAFIALVALALWTWRRLGSLDLALVAVVGGLVPLVASSVRHQGLLWIAGTVLAGECLGRLAQAGQLPAIWDTARIRRLMTGLAAASAMLFLLAPDGPRQGLGVAPGLFPASGVKALATFEPVGNLYDSPAFGGYLLWQLYPPRQVFLDTRNEVNPGLLRELARARSNGRDWDNLLSRYAIDGVLVGYDERPRALTVPSTEPGKPPTVSHHTASALLFPPESFALVHWDDVSMLFLARTEARRERLAGREYRAVQPEDWRAMLERAASDPTYRAAVQAELVRKLAEEPTCQRARWLLARLAGDTGP